jgi:hypothetical protein
MSATYEVAGRTVIKRSRDGVSHDCGICDNCIVSKIETAPEAETVSIEFKRSE